MLVSGNGSNLQAIAEACNKNQINSNITNVISNNPDAFGIVRAKRLNIPHSQLRLPCLKFDIFETHRQGAKYVLC